MDSAPESHKVLLTIEILRGILDLARGVNTTVAKSAFATDSRG